MSGNQIDLAGTQELFNHQLQEKDVFSRYRDYLDDRDKGSSIIRRGAK